MTPRARLLAALSLAAATAGAACASLTDGPSCEDGSCDETIGRCTIVDRSGGGLRKDVGDAVAKRIFAGEGACPMSFRDVMAAFKSCTNVETRVVETQAQHLDAAKLSGAKKTDALKFGGAVPELGGYHTVTSLDCGGSGPENRVLILQSRSFIEAPTDRAGKKLALDPAGLWETDGLKKPMEAIAWDKSKGVFNYYALEPADEKAAPCATGGRCAPYEWGFHGDSKMYLELDAQLNPTVQFPTTKRCGACHTGGGLIMRELNSPWINWEEDFVTPGADKLVAAHPELGSNVGSSSGAEMEGNIVGSGNALWDKSRIKHVTDPNAISSPNPMLKPLFCANEVNLQTGFPGSPVNSIDNDFFFDPLVSSAFVNTNFANRVYADAIKGTQVIPNLTAPGPASPPGLPTFGVTESAAPFMVPERGGADIEYLGRLQAAGAIDDKLIQAILAVDFTRPLFSETRCGLLRDLKLTWADVTTPSKNVTAASVRNGIEKKLKAMTSDAAKQALAALTTPAEVTTRQTAYAAACSTRATNDPAGFMRDVLTVANRMRETAYQLPIYKFIPTSMPISAGAAAGTPTANVRFRATDCTLETVAAGT
jgi:hypothetical protein